MHEFLHAYDSTTRTRSRGLALRNAKEAPTPGKGSGRLSTRGRVAMPQYRPRLSVPATRVLDETLERQLEHHHERRMLAQRRARWLYRDLREALREAIDANREADRVRAARQVLTDASQPAT